MGMVMHQTHPTDKDAETIEKVAEALGSLDDFTLALIGASGTRASEALHAAAQKASRARSAEHLRRDELATYEREIERAKARLSEVEGELAAALRDPFADEWAQEQRVNKIRAERSAVRGRLESEEQGRRGHIRAYG